jgi:DNA-binding winged helix-turn-helix (wHTH) protein
VPPEPIYSFGPYELDPARRLLLRDAEPVAVPDRQFTILHVLVGHAGQIVSRDTLVEAAWEGIAVTDNSLEHAISRLRRRLGPAADDGPYIEVLPRRGYRFRVEVSRRVARRADAMLESLLDPFRRFIEGHVAIETLERSAVLRARQAFTSILEQDPDNVRAHIGLSNALALCFDATRGGDAVDLGALQAALHHAREACRLDTESGESWATLAFVLSRAGQPVDGRAAGLRAVDLDADNWRHHVRLAYACWGEDRLRATRQALRRLPGLGLAHWLAATVFVARQAFDAARRELLMGTAAVESAGPVVPVGLHLLLGQLALAEGDLEGAARSFDAELRHASAGHIYANQACAATWCAIGAMRLDISRPEARTAFEHALDHLPGYAPALAALAASAEKSTVDEANARFERRLQALESVGGIIESATARAICHAVADRHSEAAKTLHGALLAMPASSSAGWTIPLDPLLRARAHSDDWGAVLALVRNRAL